MKINNNNLRAAKRRYNKYVPRYIADFVWPEGFNGTSYKDFLDVRANRTHKKSENAANDKESDSTAPTP